MYFVINVVLSLFFNIDKRVFQIRQWLAAYESYIYFILAIKIIIVSFKRWINSDLEFTIYQHYHEFPCLIGSYIHVIDIEFINCTDACSLGGTLWQDVTRWWTWWRHQMETFAALLALCAGNSPVTGEFLAHRPVARSFDVSFDLRLSKRLSKQSWGWWFEPSSLSLWRPRNAILPQYCNSQMSTPTYSNCLGNTLHFHFWQDNCIWLLSQVQRRMRRFCL